MDARISVGDDSPVVNLLSSPAQNTGHIFAGGWVLRVVLVKVKQTPSPRLLFKEMLFYAKLPCVDAGAALTFVQIASLWEVQSK